MAGCTSRAIAKGRLPFDTVHVFLGAIGPLTHANPRASW